MTNRKATNPKALKNITDILNICIQHRHDHVDADGNFINENALVVYDENSGLAKILLEAYHEALPHARFVDFNKSKKEEILFEFDKMKEKDLVVMIQSTNFLLNEFRIRLHLFNNKLKVIEHMHLARNTEDMWDTYINALAYDTGWYPVIAHIIKAKLDMCDTLDIWSSPCDSDHSQPPHKGGVTQMHTTKLSISGGLEPAMLNIGDYRDMNNVGGTFPIGEVFTEGKVLTNLNGEIYIYAFADRDFNVQMYEPFLIRIESGEVTWCGDNTPSLFLEILKLVRSYERPMIREIGFGLNRAITREHYLRDITAYERVYGMHLSLGEKHSVYKKSGLTTNKTKFHIDIFPVVDRVIADKDVIYENGEYV